MTAPERVHAAIHCQPVDRIPLGFYVVDHDTIENVLGRKTLVRDKVATQIALWKGRRDEVAESYKQDTVEFYRKIDCVDLLTFKEAAPLPPRDYEPDPPEKIGEKTWRDRHGNIWAYSELANMITIVEHADKSEPHYTVEDFEGPVGDVPVDPSVFEACDYLVEQLGSERYILGTSGGMQAMQLLGGMEYGLMMYAMQPEVVLAAIRRNGQYETLADKHYIRPGQDGVLLENDMAGTNGPLISPRMFERMCAPTMKERVASIKQHLPDVVLHNCGDNRPLMQYFVDAGIDCYESLQTNAGMEVGALKAKWGGRMAFWGGVALEHLVQGTPEDVRSDVRQAMERGAPGGGFILGPSHSIAYGTKYDNFMAMLDEFVKLRDKF